MLLPVLSSLSSAICFRHRWQASMPDFNFYTKLIIHSFRYPCGRYLSNSAHPAAAPISSQEEKEEEEGSGANQISQGFPFHPRGSRGFSPLASGSKSEVVRAFFQGVGVGMDDFYKLVVAHPQVIDFDVDEDIRISVALLESALGKDLVAECIVAWPSLVMSMRRVQKEVFEKQMSFLLGCGFKKNTKLLAKALNSAVKRSKEELEATLRALISHGLARAYACKLVRAQPTILSQAPMEIGRKVNYILHTFCFSPEELLTNSSFLIYNLESHLRPRYLMYQWVLSKRIIRRNFKLDYVMSLSDNQFWCKFVERHAEGPRVFKEFSGNAKPLMENT